MFRIMNQYVRFETFRGRLGGLPAWARGILTILALPGVALLVLSIVAVGVSILALLLLTVPAYRLLSAVTSSGFAAAPETKTEPSDVFPSAGRKHVEVKVVE
jgi:hypothetical protein